MVLYVKVVLANVNDNVSIIEKELLRVMQDPIGDVIGVD